MLQIETMSIIQQRLLVSYRFSLAFVIGYLCTAYFSICLTHLFNLQLPKAESIYLAAFISILFFLGFVIFSFCIHSLKKLSLISLCIFLLFFSFSQLFG